MSIDIMLHPPTREIGKTMFPDVEVCRDEEYPDLIEYIYEESDTEHVWADEYFVRGKGWCRTTSTIPYMNLCNSNAYYLLDMIDAGEIDTCGDMLDIEHSLQIAESKLDNFDADDYWYRRLQEVIVLLEKAVELNWNVYWA